MYRLNDVQPLCHQALNLVGYGVRFDGVMRTLGTTGQNVPHGALVLREALGDLSSAVDPLTSVCQRL